MKKDASPAVVRTGCPRCPRVFGTPRCGISPYPVVWLFQCFFILFLQLIAGLFDWLFRLQFDWLFNNDQHLFTIFPGSHDTMTYCLDQQSSVLESAPKVLQVLDTLFPCIVRPCIIKWATTQVVTDMMIQNCMNLFLKWNIKDWMLSWPTASVTFIALSL